MHENRLAREKSPYLLQHKNNPVDWYPWSEQAFERARAEDRPIFLSIGYATCHWCHVMERESFEDEEVARLMNDAFVNIKVDREERPDIDQVYMTACQLASGRGGWPLSVVLTPDRRPFYIATYIPRRSRPNFPGMLDLVPALKQAWQERRDEVLESAGSLTDALQRSVTVPVADELPTEATLDEAFASLAARFDRTFGGFGSAPKFPTPHNILFLIRYAQRSDRRDALDIATKTLHHMRAGGMFDQVGFGFHRYSTDEQWRLPHFEKMLYDQAMHLMAYTEAYAATNDPLFERTAREIVEYVRRDLRDEHGGFYSAEDADSEGEEGKFYVWSLDEVRDILTNDDARFTIERFGMTEEGNYAEEGTTRRNGTNVLHVGSFDGWSENDVQRWERIRETLLDRRSTRERPLLDDKILTDWNGLMIAALARAGSVLDDADMLRLAEQAAVFVFDALIENGTVLHRYREGEAAHAGMLDDYAFAIWGLLELYQASLDVVWLDRAIELQFRQFDRFEDEKDGGFYFTSEDSEKLLVRPKEFVDGALPSGNSASLLNLVRLSKMTGDPRFDDAAIRLIKQAGSLLEEMPAALTGLLLGVDFWIGPSAEIVLVDGDGMEDLAAVVRERAMRRCVVLRKTDQNAEILSRLAPFTANQTAADGRAMAYVCENFACRAPTSDPDELGEILQRVVP